jgi:hypothetical protein
MDQRKTRVHASRMAAVTGEGIRCWREEGTVWAHLATSKSQGLPSLLAVTIPCPTPIPPEVSSPRSQRALQEQLSLADPETVAGEVEDLALIGGLARGQPQIVIGLPSASKVPKGIHRDAFPRVGSLRSSKSAVVRVRLGVIQATANNPTRSKILLRLRPGF